MLLKFNRKYFQIIYLCFKIGFLSDSNLKAIWLQIAKSEINSDPSVTGELLQLSEGLLTVADVLQFFPEFATIDHFKQALCSSLEAVSKEIDDYQEKLGMLTISFIWGLNFLREKIFMIQVKRKRLLSK